MRTLNKEFAYRGYKFNMKLELETRIEKRFNGDRFHTVTVNCMDFDNYYNKREVEDRWLEAAVGDMEFQARQYIDKKFEKSQPKVDERFTNLGFK